MCASAAFSRVRFIVFYECFSDRVYAKHEWLAVLALECVLVPILQALAADSRQLSASGLKARTLYWLPRLGFPPNEVKSVASREWLLEYLSHEIPCMKEWLSKELTAGAKPPGEGGGLPCVVFNKERVMACLQVSRQFREALREPWWTTWIDKERNR